MTVCYNFNCAWNPPKKDRISRLISERVLLLTGERVFNKIGSINFCEKEWIDKPPKDNCFLSNERLVAINSTEVEDIKTYELLLEKEILLSMLIPGPGQSHFDNLILELKNSID